MFRLPIAAAAIAIALAPWLAAAAPFQAWIDFGEAVPGESTAAGHEGWADIRTFSVNREADGFALVCHRELDKASPLLAAACLDGTTFPVVRIDVSRISPEGNQLNYWELELREVTILHFDQSGAADVPAEETLTLDWKSARFIYRVFPQGGPPYQISRLVSEDSDGDGLPDAYEQLAGLDPAVDNRDLDSDGDGLTDVDEYRLGTEPGDPTSFFLATAAHDEAAGDGLVITWPSISGETYRLEYSADLVTPFAPFATVLATGPETSRMVPRSLARGFFRVAHGSTP